MYHCWSKDHSGLNCLGPWTTGYNFGDDFCHQESIIIWLLSYHSNNKVEANTRAGIQIRLKYLSASHAPKMLWEHKIRDPANFDHCKRLLNMCSRGSWIGPLKLILIFENLRQGKQVPGLHQNKDHITFPESYSTVMSI